MEKIMKIKGFLFLCFITILLFFTPLTANATSLQIDLPKEEVTLLIGEEFLPKQYAIGRINDQEVPFNEAGQVFYTIVNDVDTSVEGSYLVVYRLVDIVENDMEERALLVHVIADIKLTVSEFDVFLIKNTEFEPQNYAQATINGEQVKFSENGEEFFTSINKVDEDELGRYQVTYRLVNPNTEQYQEKTIFVEVIESALESEENISNPISDNGEEKLLETEQVEKAKQEKPAKQEIEEEFAVRNKMQISEEIGESEQQAEAGNAENMVGDVIVSGLGIFLAFALGHYLYFKNTSRR
jgi:hypothetical protein